MSAGKLYNVFIVSWTVIIVYVKQAEKKTHRYGSWPCFGPTDLYTNLFVSISEQVHVVHFGPIQIFILMQGETLLDRAPDRYI